MSANQPLFLTPALQDKIWGGTELAQFGYHLASDHVGEAWAISGHPNGQARIKNGPEAEKTLATVWQQHPDWFGDPATPDFPLLTKILDASQDLSVQVHPDDDEYPGELGKTECWYILAAEPGATIIYGHRAQSQAELAQLIADAAWSDLLRRVPVQAGDFFYVPAGTIHAIGAGVVVLETQESSDTTFRVYDFDRIDPTTGSKRALHTAEALAVTEVPSRDPELAFKTSRVDDLQIIDYLDSAYFKVSRWEMADGVATMSRGDRPYTLLSVVNGQGVLEVAGEQYPLQKGDHLILPADVTRWRFTGTFQLIATEPGERLL